MMIPTLDDQRRRAFLRRSAQLAAGGVLAPLTLNLAAFGDAAALEATDYKALVCIFLDGGNDHDNTVIPYDVASHGRYAALRSAIAVPRSDLAASQLLPRTALPDERQYALHPKASALAPLFNAGQAAVVLNVGPLIAPTTKAQYASGGHPLPPKLFSHIDQVAAWQSQAGDNRAGWGGGLGDLALSGNGGSIFTVISCGGSAVFLSGQNALRYQVGNEGPTPIWCLKGPVQGSIEVRDALERLTLSARAGMLQNEYAKVTSRSVAAESRLSSAMTPIAIRTEFPATTLAGQLRTVARMIGGRQQLGVKRQVFYVQMGSFDHHGAMPSLHPRMIGEVADAMAAFYRATVELGIASQVTAFTASDFGRTLTMNGDGTDHGWGGHYFVLGGAVKGRAFYGTAPPVSAGTANGADDSWQVGQGRLLPTTSVDQYAATLAKWFGATDSELDLVLPNLRHFDQQQAGIDYPRTLGFV